MRTDAEIVDRIRKIEKIDFFGFVRGDLIGFLPFESAKPFLKDEATSDGWEPSERDYDSVKAAMHDYMEFAWGKANGNRGLSAGRSLCHYQAWLWMLGEEEAAEALDNYSHYGKPQLRAICEKFGWDWRKWDDGRWTNCETEDGVGPEDVGPVDLPWDD